MFGVDAVWALASNGAASVANACLLLIWEMFVARVFMGLARDRGPRPDSISVVACRAC